MRHHAGQIALPGGKHDPADADLIATAMREAHEEIGLPPDALEILGATDTLVTTTGFRVTPVVAYVSRAFEPCPNPAEVERVFSAPLALFADIGWTRRVPWEGARQLIRKTPVDGEIVWGVTAAILARLITRLELES